MNSVLEEYKTFVSTYAESDYLQKCRELFAKEHGQLEDDEKSEFLDYLAQRGGDAAFIAFCEEEQVLMSLEQAESYSSTFCGKNGWGNPLFEVWQVRIGNYFIKLPEHIDAKNIGDYYLFAIKMAIKHGWICALQKLLLKNKEEGFADFELSEFEELIRNQPDRRIGRIVRNYLLNGTIGEDWQEAVNGYKYYVPDVYVDYFATTGKEICKENLKSYKKSKLLGSKTTLEELNDFVNQYNWDDGVEIPYFIMHHKNCDLALRKKLFELGAGDCIDEDTFKDPDKDPWKRFILELDEMIKKEEK